MPRPGKDGPPRFLENKHATRYGLKVSSRAGDGTILSVSCQFCSTFGRETKPGNQRKATNRVKSFQKFRAQNYRSHLEGQHPERTDSLERFALPLTRAEITPPLSWDAQMETVKVMKQRLELDIMTQSEEGLTDEAKEYLRVKRQQILRKLREE
ncbi:hypothetical protein BBJ29_002250 [Phytophthora kernoviae]|uniref:Uncharacterized protein n=2 Tax=Phytophthora kernoviae TaxID=325452 RepID=A0A3F2RIK8_9STRA|nr:hypothetical protein G195_004921 [Phytophthora kernoviae 00238/432]RLN57914.1 hypothetical protein BBP00_00007269 [Phytophthora kernoviae]RLN70917.1 hypothetical protein BBJ29_002250 [Phytophthora kernoviae]